MIKYNSNRDNMRISASSTNAVCIACLVLVVVVVAITILLLIVKKRHPKPCKPDTKEQTNVYSNYAMVIVEPRKHHLLQTVLENYSKHMEPYWDIYVFHGKSHAKFAKDAAANVLTQRNVYFQPLQTNNMKSSSEYNQLLKSKEFWDKVHAENILVIQTDSAVCANSTFSIQNFTQYDYIGCSYNDKAIGKDGTWGETHSFYGVGGLSFRKKSFMLKCIMENDNDAKNTSICEDVFFSNCAENSAAKPESADVLASFCTQDTFARKSWGVHKPTQMRNEKQRSELFEYCPEASVLLSA